MWKLNYIVKESPFSAYVTIRKTFRKDCDQGQDTFLNANGNEYLKLKDLNKDLEMRLSLA